MAPADRSFDSAFLEGLEVTNTIPELGRLVKPLMLNPGNATACLDAGLLQGDLPIRRITDFGTIERGGIGSRAQKPHQILFVLRRNESGCGV